MAVSCARARQQTNRTNEKHSWISCVCGSVKNARTRFTLVHGVCSTIHTLDTWPSSPCFQFDRASTTVGCCSVSGSPKNCILILVSPYVYCCAAALRVSVTLAICLLLTQFIIIYYLLSSDSFSSASASSPLLLFIVFLSILLCSASGLVCNVYVILNRAPSTHSRWRSRRRRPTKTATK